MTAVVMVCCTRAWRGFPCRGAFPSGVSDVAEARRLAAAAGWGIGDIDLCPAHKREADQRPPDADEESPCTC